MEWTRVGVVVAGLAVGLAGSDVRGGVARGDSVQTSGTAPAVVFADDFEGGLGRWRARGEGAVALRASGEAGHGSVLELTPNGDVVALIEGSDAWDHVRLEGEMRFPSEVDNYLGLVFHYTARDAREDFGVVYVKGNDSYLQVNPHRDFNVSRTIYPELRVPLTGAAAVKTGVWQRFALEVVGPTVHVYVGEGGRPQLTFSDFEFARGALGVQPRSVGGPAWVDNIVVRRIPRLSYDGPPVPDPTYAPRDLLTEWRAAGPFERTADDVARHPDGAGVVWTPVVADPRGAVVTGRLVDFHGPRTVTYLRTTVAAAADREGVLEFSTADDLAVWVNGVFQAFVARQDAAWFDFPQNPAHAPRRMRVPLLAGANEVVVRVRGGVYATGGFFARLAPSAAAPSQAAAPSTTPDGLQAIGVEIERVSYGGREAIRLVEASAGREGGLALLRDVAFTDGVIEVDVAGRRGPHAVPDDRGFIGVAFRTRPSADSYEYIYLRPDNGRADDQVRRNHATQYAAHPAFTFARLRKESPERYESYVDLEPGAWTRMRVEVSGRTARLFVHDGPQPALVVTDLKLGVEGGGVALWIGPGTEGFFANVRVVAR